MTSHPSCIIRLPPEIYPLIATNLPLYSTSSTLLALALVNHHISDIVLPLLNSRLILKNETDALNVIKGLRDNPELGKTVYEIHILSNLSLATRRGENPFDVITGLENLIKVSCFPNIHTLGLYLLSGWHHEIQDFQFQRVVGFGRLRSDFWINLRKNCPRLRGLILRNIADDMDDPWVDDSGLLEVQNLNRLKLYFSPFSIRSETCGRLLKKIDLLSANLATLDLALNCTESTSVSPILTITFPKLRYLSLASFYLENSAQATDFWIRHPTLESLRIFNPDDNTPWFSKDSVLSQGFLPNLKHLKAPFYEVRNLAPILGQLLSLTAYDTVNAQLPYLLRAVLPDGLPNLKSLHIGQVPSNSGKNVNIEGALWYEKEDGKFCEAKVSKARRSVLNGYIPSITRGAPNLEEIGFQSNAIGLDQFAKIAPEIAELSRLRRLYFVGPDEIANVNREALITNARTLAKVCSGLSMIIDTSADELPYMVARILRTEVGEVSSVDVRSGFSMQIGSEDDPFPE